MIFPEHVAVMVEDHGVSVKPAKNSHLRLELDKWIAAWDSYAIAACVLDQMSYSDAMAHKASVLEVRICVITGRRHGTCVCVCATPRCRYWEWRTVISPCLATL